MPPLSQNRHWQCFHCEQKNSQLEGFHYGGKLNDFSSVFIQTVTTRVLRLFSASVAAGIGAKGLTAISTTTLLIEPSGVLILMIL